MLHYAKCESSLHHGLDGHNYHGTGSLFRPHAGCSRKYASASWNFSTSLPHDVHPDVRLHKKESEESTNEGQYAHGPTSEQLEASRRRCAAYAPGYVHKQGMNWRLSRVRPRDGNNQSEAAWRNACGFLWRFDHMCRRRPGIFAVSTSLSDAELGHCTSVSVFQVRPCP